MTPNYDRYGFQKRHSGIPDKPQKAFTKSAKEPNNTRSRRTFILTSNNEPRRSSLKIYNFWDSCNTKYSRKYEKVSKENYFDYLLKISNLFSFSKKIKITFISLLVRKHSTRWRNVRVGQEARKKPTQAPPSSSSNTEDIFLLASDTPLNISKAFLPNSILYRYPYP